MIRNIPDHDSLSLVACPDASIDSAINAALSSIRDCSNPVRPELVEGNELIKKKCSYGSTGSPRTGEASPRTEKRVLIT